ncbi:MAG: 30S ribosomal protein S6 [Campylobacterales bacterium]|nr:30S ribosomal protein S6 [Campylobacterales bacterium]
MRHYENLVIVKPTLTEEEIKRNLANVEEIITSNGGEIAVRDDMGIRKLAYPIDKSPRGYFYVVYYTMDPQNIAEVERRFRINEELLRFVTIKYDAKREVKAWHELVEKAKKGPSRNEEPKIKAPAADEEE